MSGHTRGPWRWVYDEDEPGHVISMATAIVKPGAFESQHRIEYSHSLYPQGGSKAQRRQFAEAEANARLIAAAPEMYDFIAMIAAPGEISDYGPHVETARALLAKIDGAA